MSGGELKAAAAVTHALDVIAPLAPPGSQALWSCHVISPSYIFKNCSTVCLRYLISNSINYSTKLWCIYDDGPLRRFRLEVSLIALTFVWLIRRHSLGLSATTPGR